MPWFRLFYRILAKALLCYLHFCKRNCTEIFNTVCFLRQSYEINLGFLSEGSHFDRRKTSRKCTWSCVLMTSVIFWKCGNTLNAWMAAVLKNYNFMWLIIRITDVTTSVASLYVWPIYISSYVIMWHVKHEIILFYFCYLTLLITSSKTIGLLKNLHRFVLNCKELFLKQLICVLVATLRNRNFCHGCQHACPNSCVWFHCEIWWFWNENIEACWVHPNGRTSRQKRTR